MRILDYDMHYQEEENEYNQYCKSKAKKAFTLVFQLYCENCKHKDFVKISNLGWQGGTHEDALMRGGTKQAHQVGQIK